VGQKRLRKQRLSWGFPYLENSKQVGSMQIDQRTRIMKFWAEIAFLFPLQNSYFLDYSFHIKRTFVKTLQND
jgi:hypothetical protein